MGNEKLSDQRFDFTRGALAPVAEEVTIDRLDVDGEIPPGLTGMLVRNGPNPLDGTFRGDDMLSWWVGSAMLHGLTFVDGSAVAYRNRWVRTLRWEHHRHPERGPTADTQNPNVNVVHHAERLLALGEGSMPFEMSAELATVGPFGADVLPGGMTAHPKIDPTTGELFYFRADWQEPHLRYGVLDSAGRSTHQQEIAVSSAAMMHDFAITETRSIMLDLNVGYDFSMLAAGAAIPLRWLDERPSRLGVMPRSGGEVTWYDIEPCFIQHVVNAFDDGHRVVLDAVRYSHFLRFDPVSGGYEPNPLGVLWRYEIDTRTGRVGERQLFDQAVEMPRIDERKTGRRHRRTYTVEQPTDTEMRGVLAIDVSSGEVERFEVPPGDQNSEPVFVPRNDGAAGDDGWLLACVYRAETNTSDVVILDTDDLAAGAVASVRLPVVIPAGFHGSWVPVAPR